MSLLGIIFTRHSRPFRTRVTNLRENKVVQFSQKPKSFWVYSFILFLHFMIITILTQFCARLEDYLIIMRRSCKYCMCMHFQKRKKNCPKCTVGCNSPRKSSLKGNCKTQFASKVKTMCFV